MDAMRIGLAGYGLGARVFHAPMIARVDGLEIARIFSPSEATRQRAAEELGVPTTESYAALLASDIDLVVIVTPHDTHADLAVRALEAGKHVVVDKVICLTMDEGERMLRAAEKARRVLSCYQNRRWDGDFLTVRKLLDEGRVGAPYVVEARWTSPALSRRAEWRNQSARGGGMLLDLGAHMMDQLLLLAGPAEEVSARAMHTEGDVDVSTYAECSVWFANGILATMEVSAITPIARPRWHVRGSRGAYEKYGLDPQEALLRAGETPEPTNQHPEPGRLATFVEDGVATEEIPTLVGDWSEYYRNVRDALRGEAELAVRPEQCLEALKVLLAAQRAALTGGQVGVE